MNPVRAVQKARLLWQKSLTRPQLTGSPLGIFLTLRKVNPAKGQCLGSREAAELMPGDTASNGDGLPAAARMYNLYHPFDPVGFRQPPTTPP